MGCFHLFLFYSAAKDVVYKNLLIAFPGMQEKERKALAYRNYVSVAITMVEIAYLPSMSAEKLKSLIHFPISI